MIILSALFIFSGLFAQPVTTCVDFEQFPAQLQFGQSTGLNPGDVILGIEGLNVSLEEIQYPNGTTGFLDATIMNTDLGRWMAIMYLWAT